MTAPLLPYFYPTTVVLVDDDFYIIEVIAHGLDLEDKPHRAFYDSRQALTFINQDTYREKFVDRLAFTEEDRDSDSLTFNPRTLVEELFSPQRFRQVSVVVVDYEMPGMRGLELCERLQNPHLKKILLTGVADENVAIEAFNTGLIHQYIRKHDPHFLPKLKEAIRKAQQDYFRDLFYIPLQTLKKRPESTALIDPVFISYFEGLLKKHRIQEFYLMEGTGSFLMVGPDRLPYSLITLEDRHIEAYLESQGAEALSPEHLHSLTLKERIPCYYNPFKPPYLEPERLEDFLHPPMRLQGKDKTYYCVFGKGFIQIENDAVFWEENIPI